MNVKGRKAGEDGRCNRVRSLPQRKMTIARALECASDENVIRFLLTAYIQTLRCYGSARSALDPSVLGLPLNGRIDMARRLSGLYRMTREIGSTKPALQPLVQEAIDVFTIALQRLKALGVTGRPEKGCGA